MEYLYTKISIMTNIKRGRKNKGISVNETNAPNIMQNTINGIR